MAKKSRTPAPPRPVQSPKQRKDPRDPRRTRLWLAVATGVLLLVAAGAALAFTFGRGGGDEAQAGPCEVQTLAAQGQKHVPPAKIPKDFEYNSFPPTSGPHNPQTLIFTEYTEPVPQNRLLHNLEHGAVGAQYGPDVPEETVDQLVAWYRTDPRGLILAPLPDDEKAADLRDKIVLNAWVAEREDEDDPQSRILKQEGKLAVCSTFDEDAFNDFLERYRAKGPEGFQLDQLAPGSQ